VAAMTSYEIQTESSSQDLFSVIRDTGDQLTCVPCGGLSNCSHVKHAITDNLDNRIFEFNEVEVPLSLQDSVWVRLALGETGNRLAKTVSIAAAHYFTRSGLTIPEASYLEERYLGLTSPGEGRRVLRAMLIEWLRTWAVDTQPKCASRAHGIQAEVEWKNATELGKIQNYWSIILHNSCTNCQSYADMGFGDDLLPEKPDHPTIWGKAKTPAPAIHSSHGGRSAGMSSSDASIDERHRKAYEEVMAKYGIPSHPKYKPTGKRGKGNGH
jgi:hypothetical protein